MQCPKCGYEPTLTEVQKSPEGCLKCGINYTEHAKQKADAELARNNANQRRNAQPANEMRVVIVDFDMSFGSMVRLMVKLSFAIIPAVFIIALLWTAIISFFGSIFR